MERKFFDMHMANLSLNYRQKIEKGSVDWFWEHFKNQEEEKFSDAMRDVIEAEEYFPTIATIKKYLNKPYPDVKQEWPSFTELEKVTKSNIGKDSLKLIFAKLNGERGKEQYYRGMLELEKKYPDIRPISFKQAAELYKAGKRLP